MPEYSDPVTHTGWIARHGGNEDLSRFNAHLRQIDESYTQHMKHALSFAIELGLASMVCLVHAFLPFLFEKTGSSRVQRLHDRMVVNRHLLSEHESSKLSELSELSKLRKQELSSVDL